MNAEIAKKWVEALRSGEYRQSRGRLKNADGFCCLGVLCDLYAKETNQGEWRKHPAEAINDGGIVFVAHDKANRDNAGELKGPAWSITILTKDVMDWAGMRDAGGLAKGKELSLAELNDNGKPFTDIAEFIETNVSEL